MNKYEKYLDQIFSDKSKYLVGNQVGQLLIGYFNLSDQNARKIIQRASDNNIIGSSKPFTVGRGQYIYYSNKAHLDEFKLKKICKSHRPPVYRLLELIELNNGIISFYEALKIVASPIEKSSTKVSSLSDIVSSLKQLGLIVIIEDLNGMKFIIRKRVELEKERLMREHISKMYLDTVFLSDILRWLRKHNIIDNGNIRYRNKNNTSIGVKHNNLIWDAFAYTKTTGIHTNFSSSENDKKQTLVVLDVVINRNYSEIDLHGFLARVDIVRNSVKSGLRKIMPIIVSKDLDVNVLNQLSNLGIIHLNLGTVFGEHIYDIVSKLKLIRDEEFFENIEDSNILNNVENALIQIRGSGQEINLENIKGDLFEVIIYQLLTSIYPNTTILHGKLLKNREFDEKYEYDFIINNDNFDEVIIVEVKGYKRTSIIKLGDNKTKHTVKWFFRNTFPFAQKNYVSHSENMSYKACFITTAKFSNEAIEFMEPLNNSKIKSIHLNIYYDGESINNLMIQKSAKKAKQIIDKYFSD